MTTYASSAGLDPMDDLGSEGPYPDPEGADEAYERGLAHARAVSEEMRRQRVRDEARERLQAERAGAVTLPALIPLDEFLARPLPPVTHRIAGLWPMNGRVLLAAQFKAGKTTLRDNVIRCLVDAEPFLGAHDVEPITGRVALLDFELDEHTLQLWLQDQGLQHPERVNVLPMKGRAGSFNILDEQLRSRWACLLEAADTSVLVIDCLRPIMDALGLSEDKDGGRFLVAIDALAHEAGVSEVFVVHHMGHTGERSRGDSRFRDWPDAEWKLVRDKDDEDPNLDDVHGARYLSAFGRDVDLAQTELVFDRPTRHLTLGGLAPNRREAAATRKANAARPGLLEALRTSPGLTSRALRQVGKDLGVGRYQDTDDIIQSLIDQGLVHMIPTGQAHLHYLKTPTVSGASERVPDTPDTTVSRVLYGTRQLSLHTSSTQDGPGHGHGCDHCGQALTPALAAAGETTHPTCDPGAT